MRFEWRDWLDYQLRAIARIKRDIDGAEVARGVMDMPPELRLQMARDLVRGTSYVVLRSLQSAPE